MNFMKPKSIYKGGEKMCMMERLVMFIFYYNYTEKG